MHTSPSVPFIDRHALLLSLILALFTFGTAWNQLNLTPVGVPPDEMAHLTHIQEIAGENHLIPDYAHSKILKARNSGNYLSHPPLYYSLLGLTGRALGWQDAITSFIGYRILSAALVAAGMMLWVLGAVNLRIPYWKIAAAALACNAIPMFGYLAGSVNNDNLAYLAVALCFYGISAYPTRPTITCYATAAGLLIAALTKANVAVFCGLFAGIWLLQTRTDAANLFRSRHLWIAVGAMVAITLAYYLPTLIHYGTPFPVARKLYSHLAPPSAPMSKLEFLEVFFDQMIDRLPVTMSHATLAPLGDTTETIFYAMLIAPVAAFLVARLLSNRFEAGDRIAIALFTAFALVLAAHCYAVAKSYYAFGVLAAIQPRYYNFLLPGAFFACMLRPSKDRVSRAIWAFFSLLVATLLALSSSLLTKAQVEDSLTRRGSNLVAPTHIDTFKDALPIDGDAIGHIDELQRSGALIRARGWAIDEDSKAAARHIVVLYKQHFLGIAETGIQRPDVAQVLGTPNASQAGFNFTITNVPDSNLCDLTLLAEQRDGTYAQLVPISSCATAGESTTP